MKELAIDLGHGRTAIYTIPSVKEAHKLSKETWGSRYDPIEKKEIQGGIPVLWERVLK
jgi:hypothetical protein